MGDYSFSHLTLQYQENMLTIQSTYISGVEHDYYRRQLKHQIYFLNFLDDINISKSRSKIFRLTVI